MSTESQPEPAHQCQIGAEVGQKGWNTLYQLGQNSIHPKPVWGLYTFLAAVAQLVGGVGGGLSLASVQVSELRLTTFKGSEVKSCGKLHFACHQL